MRHTPSPSKRTQSDLSVHAEVRSLGPVDQDLEPAAGVLGAPINRSRWPAGRASRQSGCLDAPQRCRDTPCVPWWRELWGVPPGWRERYGDPPSDPEDVVWYRFYERPRAIFNDIFIVVLPLILGITFLQQDYWVAGGLLVAFGLAMAGLVTWRWKRAHPPSGPVP